MTSHTTVILWRILSGFELSIGGPEWLGTEDPDPVGTVSCELHTRCHFWEAFVWV